MKKIIHVAFAAIILLGISIGIGAFQPKKIKFDEITMSPAEVEGETTPQYPVMMGHLQEISQQAHPIGSAENIRVRAYIKKEMESYGYTVEEDHFTSTDPKVMERVTPEGQTLPTEIAMVNLFARVKGTDSKATTMIVSHYDSTKYGPGTTDDAVSVAAMLETMRVVQAQGTPQNDLIFLFTDGEEAGLLGAKHFVGKHTELADTVDFILNFEARGNRGGLVMFQTPKNNKKMLEHYNNAMSMPIAVSIATEVYNRVPNGTDLTEFINAGYRGTMNFAVIEGGEDYHTPNDNYERINRSTANHYLVTISDLTAYFSSVDTAESAATEDAVYFPIGKGKLITLSNSFAFALAIFAGIAGLLLAFYLLKKNTITILALVKSLGLLLTIIVLGVLIGMFGKFAATNIFGVANKIPDFLRWAGTPYLFVTAVAITGLLALALLKKANKKTVSFESFQVVYLTVLAVITIAVALILNGASYLFAIPLLASIVAIVLTKMLSQMTLAKELLACLATLVYLVLFAPIVYLLFVALTIPALYIITGLSAFVACGFFSLYVLDPQDTVTE